MVDVKTDLKYATSAVTGSISTDAKWCASKVMTLMRVMGWNAGVLWCMHS